MRITVLHADCDFCSVLTGTFLLRWIMLVLSSFSHDFASSWMSHFISFVLPDSYRFEWFVVETVHSTLVSKESVMNC